MRSGLLEILRGSFLVQEGATKNWRFIVFIFFLAGLMIAASHRVDRKVMKIASLNNEIQDLKSRFAETRTRAMHVRLESEIKANLFQKGFISSSVPPVKITVTNTQ
ncbi:MAG: FtsL-like putative cell division protein [Flavobacteriaceae bacterium]